MPASSRSSDYSATPKYEKGGIFRHVVVDYPLAQAVADGIVKMPLIGEVTGAQVELGDTSFQRNRQWLDVAVGRWRAFHETLSPAGKRPVLFVMCENTLAADEAGDYLRQLPDFAGDQLLVIHTDRSGEVSWALEDMLAPAPYRLYRATVSQHWVLDPDSSPDDRAEVTP